MKNIILFAFLILSVTLYAQNEFFPQKIESAFKSKYPNTKIDNWYGENDLFFVEFYLNGSFCTAVFDNEGLWKETSEVISELDLTSVLQEYVSNNFPYGIISYCEKVETNSSESFIRINIENNNKTVVLKSDYEGKNIEILKNEK
ncbi:MAG: PepSY-like domain-containing protein [Bacteroidales bacterium]|nr:PepSY-like domain-containing protein [Bacteroidales bacterium]